MSQTLKLYNVEGVELEPVKLTDEMFNKKINADLIHQAVVTQLGNQRYAIAHTKNRGEVTGSNRKPWKQKGTGRARTGSVKNPIWIGGGITFGPRSNRNFINKFPKKMKRAALLQALSQKITDNEVILIDKLDFKLIKTKVALKFIQSLPNIDGTCLIVTDKPNKNIEFSFRNLPFVKTILANNLNIIDLLKFKWIIFTQDSLKLFSETFDKPNKKSIVKIDKKDIKKSVNNKVNKKTVNKGEK